MVATLTWTTHGPYTFTIAGANPTVLETITGLNSTASNLTYWAVSDYSVANGTLEMKRNSTPGSPTGELATVRMLIFGKSAPNAAALCAGASGGSTTVLYAGLSVDANTTGPTTAYASGAPYSTKYTRAPILGTPSSLVTANTCRITWFEADDVLGFVVGDTTQMISCVMGRIIVGTDSSTLIWGVLPSGTTGNYTITSLPNTTATIGNAHPITSYGQTAAGPKGACWDTGSASAFQFGRTMAFISGVAVTDMGLGATTAAAMMIPVPLVGGVQAAAPTYTFFGTLRQIRFGPHAAHLQKLRDNSSVLQGTHILSGTATGIGMWLDELP